MFAALHLNTILVQGAEDATIDPGIIIPGSEDWSQV